MNLLGRKVKIAHYRVPLIFLLLIVAGTVAAVANIIYQFSVDITVDQYPKVTFWDWSTGQKTNTFTYSVTIFPDIKTTDENITHGIFCDDASDHTCYLRTSNVATSENIAILNITIYDSSGTVFTKEWTDFSSLPTDWESFTAGANKKYAIWIEITGASGASGTSAITIDMKIENP